MQGTYVWDVTRPVSAAQSLLISLPALPRQSLHLMLFCSISIALSTIPCRLYSNYTISIQSLVRMRYSKLYPVFQSDFLAVENIAELAGVLFECFAVDFKRG